MAEEITNFREICIGDITPKTLYRSNHPNTGGTQAAIIERLARKANIQCVLNLHESEKQMRTEPIVSWYRELIRKECIIALNMDFNFLSNEFTEKLHAGLDYMLWHNGPYLIHCFAGFDRTGFVCAVLEALMGASLKEIVEDYCISFRRKFTSNLNDGQRVNTPGIIIKQLTAMNEGVQITDENLQCAAQKYLLEKVGLSNDELILLKEILQGKILCVPMANKKEKLV